jgi:lactoylglutathione lyase
MDLDHIVLTVSDLELSARHYDVLMPLLGFAKTRPHVYANRQGVAVDLQQATDPTYAYKRGGVGLNHLAVRASSRAEVDELARQLKEAGLEVPHVQIIDTAYALFMLDRDGLRVEISFDP